MQNRYSIFTFIFLCVLFSQSMNAQTPEPILFGTYLPSSDYPEITYHRFNDTNLVKLGFNTILQTVMHDSIHKDSIAFYKYAQKKVWKDNRSSLKNSSFENIVAMNGMWVRDDPTEVQIDWLKILTHGVYNPWEVEGVALAPKSFYSSEIKMEINDAISDRYNEDGVKGIKTNARFTPEMLESTQNLLKGPSVYQDQNYKTGFRYDSDPIPYIAKFRMKIGYKPDTTLDIGKLQVIIKYPTGTNTDNSIVLQTWDLTTNNFGGTDYIEIEVPFTIEGLPQNIIDHPSSGGIEGIDALDIINTRILYEVNLARGTDPEQYGHLYIDKITVTDAVIWDQYSNQILDKLNSYHNIWASTDTSSVYQDKIKYFYTMDEPHSYDHFWPYNLVEDAQKTLNNAFGIK